VLPDGTSLHVHTHAVRQAAERLDIPAAWVDGLSSGEPWQRALAAHNLSEATRRSGKRILTRAVDTRLMAVLSDRYRRLDSRPIVEALITEAKTAGAIVADGVASDTRASLRIVHPEPVEVIPGDWAVLGLGWSNSDYGDGALNFHAFLLRLICLNGAMRESALRQVHLGRRLEDGVSFSDATWQLDTEATVSASRDVTRHLLGAIKRDELIEQIRAAASKEVNAQAQLVALQKRSQISKAESAEIAKVYTSADIEVLPPGQNKWRFSNAISFLARNTENPGRRMELERLAGEALNGAAAAA
jgi:hypothetical protein